jgi:hypothetical protein
MQQSVTKLASNAAPKTSFPQNATSGKLKSAKADTGAVVGAIAESADQFENSVVSKVSEVMTKTNK